MKKKKVNFETIGAVQRDLYMCCIRKFVFTQLPEYIRTLDEIEDRHIVELTKRFKGLGIEKSMECCCSLIEEGQLELQILDKERFKVILYCDEGDEVLYNTVDDSDNDKGDDEDDDANWWK